MACHPLAVNSFDRMTLVTTALTESSSSTLCRVKLFLLFRSLWVFNLFQLLFRRPGLLLNATNLLNSLSQTLKQRRALTYRFIRACIASPTQIRVGRERRGEAERQVWSLSEGE